ncbi:MAG: glycosyl transferase family 1, partial [Verrucomicrobiota bacterium]|nr:glycosyl transferase family 1 [Verrucomicrobiota bacterium]
IATGVRELLSDESRRHAMRKSAYLLGREMIWPVVAQRYMGTFDKARAGRTQLPRKAFARQTLENRGYQLPPLKLDHLWRLTDSTGILQHAVFTVPNYFEGYCTDDNARAFIFTILLEQMGTRYAPDVQHLSTTYLAFLWFAFDETLGRFRNFMSYNRRWLEKKGSEDSHSRSLWALGTALGRSQNAGHRNLCGRLFEAALPAVAKFKSPRAWAFTLIAIHEYLRSFSGDRAANTARENLANKLLDLYTANSSPEWPWFESSLTYDNAKLSHALILTGYWTSHREMLDIGLNSLRWLAEVQTSETRCFSPIGSNGFYIKGSTRARFDQQPLEAHAMLSACLEAFRMTNDTFWSDQAQRTFEWFLGRNDLGLPLYDSATGGCRDALHPDRVNQNQGAESSLAFYLSLAEMSLAQNIIQSETRTAA